MPMPNRQVTDGNYRYAFQGQEKDAETGKEAFELRLWDGRIGRWLTVDPMGEFSSPYLGMGNNPISKIDPTGGSTEDPPGWEGENGDYYFDFLTGQEYNYIADQGWTEIASVVAKPARNVTAGEYYGFSGRDPHNSLGKTHMMIMSGQNRETTMQVQDPWVEDQYRQLMVMDLGLSSMGIGGSASMGMASLGMKNTMVGPRQYNYTPRYNTTPIRPAPSPKFDINSPSSFRGADPNSIKGHLEASGWKITGLRKGRPGFRAINPDNPSDVIQVNTGNAPKLKPGTQIPLVKQGAYMNRNSLGWDRVPLAGNPALN